MQRKFLTYSLLFFLPVILGYVAVELLSRELPSSFKENQRYLNENAQQIETLVLGSSQMQGAINPEWLDAPSINMASGDQHHDTDFKILKGMISKLPKLKTVVLEVSYSHFELPHNGKHFWKNSLYLKYYEVNCFERTTYFKDRFLYLAHPKFFSRRLHKKYMEGIERTKYNDFGFDMNNYEGAFKDLNFDPERIANMPNFKINRQPNLAIFELNSTLFLEMLDFLSEKNIEVIITQVPMYATYHDKKVKEILERRNNLVSQVLNDYSNTHLLDRENDTISYQVEDFWNQSHLNPRGARKFTTSLNELVNSLK